MSTLNKHTAPGQALGYFFQLERALSWLAKSPIGAVIGIETEDDVVVNLESGGIILEQDKSSTTNRFPFNPNQIDFWKTLLIWLNALKNKEIPCEEPHPTFYMVTNKISHNQFVNEMGNAKSDSEASEIVKKLRSFALNVPNSVEELANKVMSYNDKQLIYLIRQISFIDGTSSINKNIIISDLQLPKEDVDYYIERLTGYIFQLSVDAWREKKPALLYRDDFMRLKNKLIQEHLNDIFNEETIKVSDIAINTEIENSGSIYIEQLRIIDKEDSAIREAIEDYLKSSQARSNMAKKGYLWEQAFQNTFSELERRWKIIYQQKKRIQNSHKWSDETVGQEILDSTLNYKAVINGYPTQNYYLTAGSYHFLANDLRVGWHPNYKNHFKEDTNEEDT